LFSLLTNRLKSRLAGALILFLVVFVGAGNSTAQAQKITVRLLNAKTGKPMSGKMVTLEWRGTSDEAVIKSDDQGLGTVQVPAGKHEFGLLAGPKVGKEPYRIPYFDCNESKTELFIQLSSVLQNGLVLRNTCGQQSAIAKPGEIVFWLLPLPWWEPDMQ